MPKEKTRNAEWAAYVKQPTFSDSMMGFIRMMLPFGSTVRLRLIPFIKDLAYTDQKEVVLAPINPFVEEERTIIEKQIFSMGIVAHEVGHILFTNFQTSETLLTAIGKFKVDETESDDLAGTRFLNEIFPGADLSIFTQNDINTVGEMVREKYLVAVANRLHKEENALEDEWMERKVKGTFPGGMLERILGRVKDKIVALPSFKGAGVGNTYLCMCRWQQIPEKRSFPAKKKELQKFLPVIEDALTKDKIEDRYLATLLFIVRFYPYFKDQIVEKMKGQQGGGQPGKKSGSPGGNASKGNNGTQNGASGQDTQEGKPKTAGSKSKDGENQDSEAGKDGDPKDKDSDNGNGEEPGDPVPEEIKAEQETLEAILKQIQKSIESQKEILDPGDKKSEQEENKPEENAPDPKDGEDQNEALKRQIEKMMDEAAEVDAEIQENERKKEEIKEKERKLLKLVHATGYNRKVTIPQETGSGVLPPDLSKQAEDIAEAIRDVIMTEEEEETDFVGEEFDLDSIGLRGVPQKLLNFHEDDQAELAILFVYDMSGSMDGHRIRQCRNNAKLMYEVGRLLHIPTAVIGFRESIFAYADYDETDADTVFKRINTMDADDGNDDAMALRFGIELIKDRPESTKVIVMTTDGQPCCLERDLLEAIELARKEQVEVISAAIADDKDEICRLYGPDRFLNITDLNRLGESFAELILSFL